MAIYIIEWEKGSYHVILLLDATGEHLLEVDKISKERGEVILKQLEKRTISRQRS